MNILKLFKKNRKGTPNNLQNLKEVLEEEKQYSWTPEELETENKRFEMLSPEEQKKELNRADEEAHAWPLTPEELQELNKEYSPKFVKEMQKAVIDVLDQKFDFKSEANFNRAIENTLSLTGSLKYTDNPTSQKVQNQEPKLLWFELELPKSVNDIGIKPFDVKLTESDFIEDVRLESKLPYDIQDILKSKLKENYQKVKAHSTLSKVTQKSFQKHFQPKAQSLKF